MIYANELRIGNWVQVLGVYKESIDKAGLVQCDAELIKLCSDSKIGLLEIQLTNEILKKTSFIYEGESVDSDWFYKLISISTNSHPSIITYELNLFSVEKPNMFGINLEEQYFGYCNTLHRLQNIYFALTGEELNIDL